MTFDIPSEYEPAISEAVANGSFPSTEDALRHALELFAKEQRKRNADLEAIREGLAEADAGLGKPLAEFDAEFRQRNGFAPKSGS